MELEFSRQIVEKVSDTMFNQNPYSGSRVVPCGRTDIRTNMAKLVVVFRNFAKTLKKSFLQKPSASPLGVKAKYTINS